MDQIKIGKFIAALRKENGLTQQALGEELGVTNKTISRWENGAYMPDVEMFKILSGKFQVSINELLYGERLNDGDFRKVADENIVSMGKCAAFSIKEKTNYWKHKWEKEHIAMRLFCFLFCAGLFVFAWLREIIWLVGTDMLLWLAVNMVLRNKMMIYVENQIYGAISQ